MSSQPMGVRCGRPSVPDAKPVVVIAGRPNVGKSTLFNRIMGKRVAIVQERPGVTRDRKEAIADWRGREFVLVDTGGWMPSGDVLDGKVAGQAERALEDADVVLLVTDGSVGITDDDVDVADLVRRLDRPTLVVVNKLDDEGHEPTMWEFVSLGLGEPAPLSAPPRSAYWRPT